MSKLKRLLHTISNYHKMLFVILNTKFNSVWMIFTLTIFISSFRSILSIFFQHFTFISTLESFQNEPGSSWINFKAFESVKKLQRTFVKGLLQRDLRTWNFTKGTKFNRQKWKGKWICGLWLFNIFKNYFMQF